MFQGEVRIEPQGDELMAARRQVRFAPADHISPHHTGLEDKEEAEGEV
jgi:hypothetical protein